MQRALAISDGCMNRFNLGVLLQEHTRSWRSAVVQYQEALVLCGYKRKEEQDDDNHDDVVQTNVPTHDGVTTVHADVDIVNLHARLARVMEAGGQLPNALNILTRTLHILSDRSAHQQTLLLVSHPKGKQMDWRNAWKLTNITWSDTLRQTSALMSSMGKHAEAIDYALRGREIAMAVYGIETKYTGEENSNFEINNSRGHLQSLIDLGNAYLHAGHLQLAKEHYMRVLDSAPKHGTGLNNYGAVCYRLGEYEEAKKSFLKMFKNNPRDKRAIEGMKMLKGVGKMKKRKEWSLFGALSDL